VEMHSGRHVVHLEHVLSDPGDRKVSSLRGPTPFPCFARVHVRTPFLGQALEVRLEGRALAAGV